MSLLGQHGYGKSDKIERGLRDDSLSGVVLSPRDEQPDRMAAYIDGLRREFGDAPELLFDPQFYASTVMPARDGNLPDYPYYQSGLTRGRFIASADVQRYTRTALEYQRTLSVSRFISPTVLFGDFVEPWNQIALSLGQESLAVHAGLNDARELLVSFVFDETALRNKGAIDDFLDIISVWDVDGFYFAVRRNDRSYQAEFEDTALANLMYVTYVLSEVNGYDVVHGYMDLPGLLLRAAGADAIATGWYNSLRQFSLSRFQPATGGSPARARYTSVPLMNSVLVIPEMQAAFALGRIQDMMSNTRYDAALSNGPANAAWPADVSCLHHWESLQMLSAEIASGVSVAENLARIEARVVRTQGLYSLLTGVGVPFEPATGSREVDTWSRAIRLFRKDAGI